MESTTELDPFSLDGMIDDVNMQPPKIIVYGVKGIGKTSFGSFFPNPILMMTENGVGTLRVTRFPKVMTTYNEVIRGIGALHAGGHDRQTLVLDSLDWLEPIIWAETARRHNKTSIEDFDFGKGFVFASEVWTEVLTGFDALNTEQGMSIVCLAHEDVKRFQSPVVEPFDRYGIKLHKRASALVQEWADIVGFAHWQTATTATDLGFKKRAVRGISSGERLLALEERPAWEAKNRFQLPPLMALDANALLTLLGQRYDPAPMVEADLLSSEA